MITAPAWLETSQLFPVLISDKPGDDTGIIVVVPSFDEPGITGLLDSFLRCYPPDCKCEVLIIVNAPENAHSETLAHNRETVRDIGIWAGKHKSSFFRIYVSDLGQPGIKGWGVGLARKAGMDEAAKRFLAIKKPDGIIASIDADCTVSRNYFIALENELLNKKNRNGCSIYFEHPISGNDFPAEIYNAAYQYELHLRYYFQALKYAGYPNVFHTVGSSMAVKASAYIKAGGMNRNQAGEDFYFIQKVVSAGGFFSLNSTVVYPSSRISNRVPFGTGVVVGKLISNPSTELLTYNPLSFSDLKCLFEKTGTFFGSSQEELISHFEGFPVSVRGFMKMDIWKEKITEIMANTSGPDTFRKRFYDWFNMFRVVKFLNFAHEELYEKVAVSAAANVILKLSGLDPCEASAKGLLEYFRSLEKEV